MTQLLSATAVLIVLATFFSAEAAFKFRAREHFEWHQYEQSGTGLSERFFGLSNTINAWYEKPFRYSVGLALGPVIGSARNSDGEQTFLGDEVKLWVAGIEAKYFPFDDIKAFVRLGLSWHRLDGRGALGDLEGWGHYLGLGWEIPVWRVSIAPELALRHVYLNRDVRGEIFTPSIGLHFYPGLGE